MKKLTAITLAALVSLPSFTGISYANSIKRYPGQTEYMEKYRNANFSDIRNRWSEEAVYTIASLGIVKGVGNSNYAPTGTLTKEQTLILLIRLLGKEGQAQRLGLDMSPNLDTGGYYQLSNYHYSVKGAIALAESLGILTQEDLANITPISTTARRQIETRVSRELSNYRGLGLSTDQLGNIEELIREKREREYRWQSPASRELVAYWLGRATSQTGGITGDNQQAINTFVDWEAINGKYAPYIEEILQKGFMQGGSGNRFYPKSTITREQMAQVIYNAHEEELRSQNYLMESGKIIDISIEKSYQNGETTNRRIIKVQTEDNDIIEIYGQSSPSGNANNDKGIISYINGELSTQSSLREGQYIKYYIKPSGEVAFVKTLSYQPDLVYGKVIARYDDMLLIEDSLGDTHRYRLSDRVDFKVNGVWQELDTLVGQMKGSFTVLNGKVTNIDISLDEGGIGGGGDIAIGDYFHTGSVISTTSSSIVLSRDSGDSSIKTYDLSLYPSVPVYRDGQRISLTSVRAGDIATIYFSDTAGTIDSIKLDSFKNRTVENIYKGHIEYYNRNTNQIRLAGSWSLDSTSSWQSQSGTKTLDIDDSADLYVTDESGTTDTLISRDTFEDYTTYSGQREKYIEYALKNNQDIYLYTEKKGSGEVITRIVHRGLGEYKYQGRVEDISKGTISLASNKNIYYNNSTMVLKEGQLIDPLSIREDDTLTVYTHHGRNTAGVIVVEGRSVSDYPYNVYSTRLSGVNLTNQTIDVSGTGSEKVSGKNVNHLPTETLNISTDTLVEHIESSTSTEKLSATEFLDRYYSDFEFYNVKLIADSQDNVLKIQLYSSLFVRPRLTDIRTAVLSSKDLSTGTVELENVRTWSGSTWDTNLGSLSLDLSRAIIVSGGRVVGLDRVLDGSRVDVIGDVNTGHTLIVR